MIKNRLFEDFPAISPEEWKAKVTADLKGADYDKRLIWRTEEGFDVQPYYRQEELENLATIKNGSGNALFLKSNAENGNDWKIQQDFRIVSTPEACNSSMVNAISRGAGSIGLNLKNYSEVTGDLLQKLFRNINLEAIELNFTGVKEPLQLYNALKEFVKSSGIDPLSFAGTLGADPLGDLAATGEYNESVIVQLATILYDPYLPHFRSITINAGLFQDSGSTLSQELGFGLAMANEMMGLLSEKGLTPEQIAKAVSFSFVTGPNYFMEIAKLRAARWLWTAICKEWGISNDAARMKIHSRSALWNMTVYDPNVNMLRTTTEAMSASLGGSDSISVLPYDIAFREQNDFSSRAARNTQIILQEEAWFSKVADPAAGSYYIEELTESIAGQGWKHFLEVEEKKGFLASFGQGFIQEQVAISAEGKKRQAASRRDSILGVNQYPNFSEMILQQGITLPAEAMKKETSYTPLQPFRVASEFEKLRYQTEQSGRRPGVFLLKYGDPAWRTARAMFAGNFFACAGYRIIDQPGFGSIEAGIKEARKEKADIVVLCSSDSEYPEFAPEAFNALQDTAEVVIAGYPKESIDELTAKGLKHFIHMKTNLLEELQKFQSLLNIEPKKKNE